MKRNGEKKKKNERVCGFHGNLDMNESDVDRTTTEKVRKIFI
jgi:hypothetical protein